MGQSRLEWRGGKGGKGQKTEETRSRGRNHWRRIEHGGKEWKKLTSYKGRLDEDFPDSVDTASTNERIYPRARSCEPSKRRRIKKKNFCISLPLFDRVAILSIDTIRRRHRLGKRKKTNV